MDGEVPRGWTGRFPGGLCMDREVPRGSLRGPGGLGRGPEALWLPMLTAQQIRHGRMNQGLLSNHHEQTFLRDPLLKHRTGRSLYETSYL